MTSLTNADRTGALPILDAGRAQAVLYQVLLVGAAVALPSLAHGVGLPVRMLLPMHWPVLLAGLVYGWRAGAFVGVATPALTFLLSGAPAPVMLPALTLEMAAYGVVGGVGRERLRLGPFASVVLALLAGRILFALSVLATGVGGGEPGAYLLAALLPGLPAAGAQAVLLPPLARVWIRLGTRSGPEGGRGR